MAAVWGQLLAGGGVHEAARHHRRQRHGAARLDHLLQQLEGGDGGAVRAAQLEHARDGREAALADVRQEQQQVRHAFRAPRQPLARRVLQRLDQLLAQGLDLRAARQVRDLCNMEAMGSSAS